MWVLSRPGGRGGRGRSKAFEPESRTFEVLVRNVRLNGLQERVNPVRAAVGQSEGTIQMTTDLGTENYVMPGTTAKNSATVEDGRIGQRVV